MENLKNQTKTATRINPPRICIALAKILLILVGNCWDLLPQIKNDTKLKNIMVGIKKRVLICTPIMNANVNVNGNINGKKKAEINKYPNSSILFLLTKRFSIKYHNCLGVKNKVFSEEII
ncbi:MAG: hypothetical protein F6K35_00560 [Okeania sp. SIO2H7]|nr:hypothetical protein [Okeania sp. SIO2H7]